MGSVTATNLVINGQFLGVAIKESCSSISIFLLLVIPHGIFEIPAIIIAGAAGFKIPYEIIRYLMGKKEQPLTKQDIKEYLTLALISIILIVIAVLEAYITPRIAAIAMTENKQKSQVVEEVIRASKSKWKEYDETIKNFPIAKFGKDIAEEVS